MKTFRVMAGGACREVGTWDGIYRTLCELLGQEAGDIGEGRHLDFANAESWCELIGYGGTEYVGDGFSIEVLEDFGDADSPA